jgi:hypothetical protein
MTKISALHTTLKEDRPLEWFRNCRIGLGLHWTAKSQPLAGAALDFNSAVKAFDIRRVMDAVAMVNADYILLTTTHALQCFPAPHPVIDGILPGRTATRDLIGELGEALNKSGKHLILYYNHSCNCGEDSAWETAVGYKDTPLHRFTDHFLNIVRWAGERYGKLVSAWWFDSCYSLDAGGPHNSVACDLSNYQFPWNDLVAAARAGHSDRLVALNSGVNEDYLYSDTTDYWAGEQNTLAYPPTAPARPNGLLWHTWVTFDNLGWVHDKPNTPLAEPMFSAEATGDYLKQAARHRAPVTFNLDISQEGIVSPASLKCLAAAVKS